MSRLVIVDLPGLNAVVSANPNAMPAQFGIDKKNRLYFDVSDQSKRFLDRFRSRASVLDHKRFHHWQVGVAINLMALRAGISMPIPVFTDNPLAKALNGFTIAIRQSQKPAFETNQSVDKLSRICQFYNAMRKNKCAPLEFERNDVFLACPSGYADYYFHVFSNTATERAVTPISMVSLNDHTAIQDPELLERISTIGDERALAVGHYEDETDGLETIWVKDE